MSEDMRVSRKREMERLDAVGRELERDQLWQEDYERTLERREKRSSWTSWFKKSDKNDKKEAAPVVSSRIGGTGQNVR